MTQFKEKAGKHRENVSVGLYAYPNLMAADILAYKATHVPVGEDQKQHLELAATSPRSSTTTTASTLFPVVEPLIFGPATRVMSLRDGTTKMSKSDPSDYSRINLTDDADLIRLKIRKAQDRSGGAAGDAGWAWRTAGGGEPDRHLRGAGRSHQRGGLPTIRRQPVLSV